MFYFTCVDLISPLDKKCFKAESTSYRFYYPLSACPWRRQWHPTPVLLPGKSHGQRSLVGCSPWGCEESDTTEAT